MKDRTELWCSEAGQILQPHPWAAEAPCDLGRRALRRGVQGALIALESKRPRWAVVDQD